jgi:hypothetical protein
MFKYINIILKNLNNKKMKKIMFFAVVLFGLSVIISSNAFTQPQTQTPTYVTIVNKTGMTVTDLYFSIIGADNWGFDVVPKDDFSDGTTLKFKFDLVDKDHCNWDIRYVTSDGKSAILRNIKLCEQTVILAK